MKKESKLNLNAGDYAISHCDSDKTYNGLEVHKMLCDAYIAGNNDTLEDDDERIKNSLINLIKMSNEVGGLALHKWEADKMLAWLEKQGQVKESFISQHENKMCKENGNSLTCEDEKVRKELIDAVQGLWDNDALPMPLSVKRKDKWISWLERQGEHANFLSKIQVGDKVTRNENGVLVNLSQLKRVAKPRKKQCEQKLEMKTAEESLGIDSDTYNKIVDECIFGEQKPIEENNGNLGGNSSNWSEEDEIRLNTIIHDITIDKSMCKYEVGKSICDEQINWLKSIKDRVQPQNHWKPSDEQMMAFLYHCSNGSVLSSLYNDLNKLKEKV